jgi:hypothetical protein
MHIPEDALLQYEYLSPIGECLFPRSAPTDHPRVQMPACRWLPAFTLELRRGRSPWRPRFPVRVKSLHIHFHFNTYSLCTSTSTSISFQFRLTTASTPVLDT